MFNYGLFADSIVNSTCLNRTLVIFIKIYRTIILKTIAVGIIVFIYRGKVI